jgi:hypothetical protein
MKYRSIFLASCFAGIVVSGTPLALSYPTGQLLTPEEWQRIASQAFCDGDIVVLMDGKKMCGTVSFLPALQFPFGTIHFRPDEVAALNYTTESGVLKGQYITHNGQQFIGAIAKEKIYFTIIPEPGQEVQPEIQIDPTNVSFILLHRDKNTKYSLSKNQFYLHLKSGDSLPIFLSKEKITFSDGWKEKDFYPHEIVELNFNGGLSGRLKKAGVISDLEFSFLKEKYLNVQIPKTRDAVRLPWEQVDKIVKDDGEYSLLTADIPREGQPFDYYAFHNTNNPKKEVPTEAVVSVAILEEKPSIVNQELLSVLEQDPEYKERLNQPFTLPLLEEDPEKQKDQLRSMMGPQEHVSKVLAKGGVPEQGIAVDEGDIRSMLYRYYENRMNTGTGSGGQTRDTYNEDKEYQDRLYEQRLQDRQYQDRQNQRRLQDQQNQDRLYQDRLRQQRVLSEEDVTPLYEKIAAIKHAHPDEELIHNTFTSLITIDKDNVKKRDTWDEDWDTLFSVDRGKKLEFYDETFDEVVAPTQLQDRQMEAAWEINLLLLAEDAMKVPKTITQKQEEPKEEKKVVKGPGIGKVLNENLNVALSNFKNFLEKAQEAFAQQPEEEQPKPFYTELDLPHDDINIDELLVSNDADIPDSLLHDSSNSPEEIEKWINDIDKENQNNKIDIDKIDPHPAWEKLDKNEGKEITLAEPFFEFTSPVALPQVQQNYYETNSRLWKDTYAVEYRNIRHNIIEEDRKWDESLALIEWALTQELKEEIKYPETTVNHDVLSNKTLNIVGTHVGDKSIEEDYWNQELILSSASAGEDGIAILWNHLDIPDHPTAHYVPPEAPKEDDSIEKFERLIESLSRESEQSLGTPVSDNVEIPSAGFIAEEIPDTKQVIAVSDDTQNKDEEEARDYRNQTSRIDQMMNIIISNPPIASNDDYESPVDPEEKIVADAEVEEEEQVPSLQEKSLETYVPEEHNAEYATREVGVIDQNALSFAEVQAVIKESDRRWERSVDHTLRNIQISNEKELTQEEIDEAVSKLQNHIQPLIQSFNEKIENIKIAQENEKQNTDEAASPEKEERKQEAANEHSEALKLWIDSLNKTFEVKNSDEVALNQNDSEQINYTPEEQKAVNDFAVQNAELFDQINQLTHEEDIESRKALEERNRIILFNKMNQLSYEEEVETRKAIEERNRVALHDQINELAHVEGIETRKAQVALHDQINQLAHVEKVETRKAQVALHDQINQLSHVEKVETRKAIEERKLTVERAQKAANDIADQLTPFVDQFNQAIAQAELDALNKLKEEQVAAEKAEQEITNTIDQYVNQLNTAISQTVAQAEVVSLNELKVREAAAEKAQQAVNDTINQFTPFVEELNQAAITAELETLKEIEERKERTIKAQKVAIEIVEQINPVVDHFNVAIANAEIDTLNVLKAKQAATNSAKKAISETIDQYVSQVNDAISQTAAQAELVSLNELKERNASAEKAQQAVIDTIDQFTPIVDHFNQAVVTAELETLKEIEERKATSLRAQKAAIDVVEQLNPVADHFNQAIAIAELEALNNLKAKHVAKVKAQQEIKETIDQYISQVNEVIYETAAHANRVAQNEQNERNASAEKAQKAVSDVIEQFNPFVDHFNQAVVTSELETLKEIEERNATSQRAQKAVIDVFEQFTPVADHFSQAVQVAQEDYNQALELASLQKVEDGSLEDDGEIDEITLIEPPKKAHEQIADVDKTDQPNSSDGEKSDDGEIEEQKHSTIAKAPEVIDDEEEVILFKDSSFNEDDRLIIEEENVGHITDEQFDDIKHAISEVMKDLNAVQEEKAPIALSDSLEEQAPVAEAKQEFTQPTPQNSIKDVRVLKKARGKTNIVYSGVAFKEWKSGVGVKVKKHQNAVAKLNDITKMVSLGQFYIDRKEVTNEEYAEFIKATHRNAPLNWLEGKIPDGLETAPVVFVTYQDAADYASWAGKRLPTDAEWDAAEQAAKSNRQLKNFDEDSKTNVAEWTSTCYGVCEHNGPHFKIIRRGTVTDAEKRVPVIEKAPMYQEDCNSNTGFRCVVDK